MNHYIMPEGEMPMIVGMMNEMGFNLVMNGEKKHTGYNTMYYDI